MRASEASFAVISRIRGRQALWLARWNRRWQAYNFVGGHKRQEEGFRACLLREIHEELGLAPDSDFRVASEPLGYYEYMGYSESAHQETHYAVEPFRVEPASAEVWRKLNTCSWNRWLAAAEIRAQSSSDGRAISRTMMLILDRVGWVG